MTGRATPPHAGDPAAPELAGRGRPARWPRLLVALAAVTAVMAIVPGFTGASAPGPAPARLAWWTPPSHSDVVLHLWAAGSCEQRDGWFTIRTALDRVTVEPGPDDIVVTAHLAAESVRSVEPSACATAGGPIAVDVRLGEPVGDRVVLDGSCRPAAPPAARERHPGRCP